VIGEASNRAAYFVAAPVGRDWHVADLGQWLTLVRDAQNNGHVHEAAKSALMT
jgi:hypothetical protein